MPNWCSDAPLAVVAGDRFVVRSYSPVTTVGGGMILDPLAEKHKRFAKEVLEEFRLLSGGGEIEKLTVVMARAGIGGITEPRLVIRTGIRRVELRKRLEGMFSARSAMLVDREETRVLSGPVYTHLQMAIIGELKGERISRTISP